MTAKEKAANGPKSGARDESAPRSRYVVDLSKDRSRTRSAPHLIASRRCYACNQVDDSPSAKSNAREYIRTIAGHCRDTTDYLLPDTPLKEAIFRVILARGNKETTAEDVSRELSEQWSTSAYPRDVSPGLLGRLMDRSDFYCIVRVPEPEPDPETATG